MVRRSNALQGWAYGRRFRYREVAGFSASRPRPRWPSRPARHQAAQAGLAFGPSRVLLRGLRPAQASAPARRPAAPAFSVSRSPPGPRPGSGTWAPSKPAATGIRRRLRDARRNRTVPRAGQGPVPRTRRRPDTAAAMGAALATRLRSAGHTLATRQITNYQKLPRHGRSAFAAAPHYQRCRNEINKALTPTPRGQAPTRGWSRGRSMIGRLLDRARCRGRDHVSGSPPPEPRPFQDRFGGLNHDSWRVLRCDHERRAGRGKVTKLR